MHARAHVTRDSIIVFQVFGGNEYHMVSGMGFRPMPTSVDQIQDTVANCHICCTHQRNNSKEPMIAHEIPTRPWSQVGADLFEINNQNYLVMIDYYRFH